MTSENQVPDALTFAELRLANILTPQRSPSIVTGLHPALPPDMDVASMARALAEEVIQADRLAAALGVDLAAVIRERFDPVTKHIRNFEPIRPGKVIMCSRAFGEVIQQAGDLVDELERKRSGAGVQG